ncbi:MAG: hypothetical protein ABEJ61_00820 [Haloferacaceae archaeon]
MPVVLTCADCGRGYSLGTVLGDSDAHGSRPLQCPNCYALLGRTRQG